MKLNEGDLAENIFLCNVGVKKYANYPNYKLTANFSITIVSGQSSDHYLIYRVGLYFTAVRIYMAADCENL